MDNLFRLEIVLSIIVFIFVGLTFTGWGSRKVVFNILGTLSIVSAVCSCIEGVYYQRWGYLLLVPFCTTISVYWFKKEE